MLWYIQALSRGNRIVSTDAMPQRYQGSSKSSQCVSDNYFYGSANQEIVDASVHGNEKKGGVVTGVPYPLNIRSLCNIKKKKRNLVKFSCNNQTL